MVALAVNTVKLNIVRFGLLQLSSRLREYPEEKSNVPLGFRFPIELVLRREQSLFPSGWIGCCSVWKVSRYRYNKLQQVHEEW
ncbi:hypothetical protein CEXT_41481 [Caerostris extrusa]|uniref:Uncharacterized protein n=1 Tax=Caerostris extrusa TaxID=172846 RepID=A0AAV4XWN6_CAEEX|nr:hypothetical protein CEXT_41481 [Caerostris extrusa]